MWEVGENSVTVTVPWPLDPSTAEELPFLPGHVPTHVDAAVLLEEGPGHLLAVALEVVLHVLCWGLLLLWGGISREGDLQVSQDPDLEETPELLSAT